MPCRGWKGARHVAHWHWNIKAEGRCKLSIPRGTGSNPKAFNQAWPWLNSQGDTELCANPTSLKSCFLPGAWVGFQWCTDLTAVFSVRLYSTSCLIRTTGLSPLASSSIERTLKTNASFTHAHVVLNTRCWRCVTGCLCLWQGLKWVGCTRWELLTRSPLQAVKTWDPKQFSNYSLAVIPHLPFSPKHI